MAEFDVNKAEKLEQKYDTSLQTRAINSLHIKFTFAFSIIFSTYHYITAGLISLPIDYGIWPRICPGYPSCVYRVSSHSGNSEQGGP